MKILHPYRFSHSKANEILKLNPREFFVLFRTIKLIWYSNGGCVSYNKISENIEPHIIMVGKYIEKLCKVGLLKKSAEGNIFYGDYDSSEKSYYKIDYSDYRKLGEQLSIDELYIYFHLLMRSDAGCSVLKTEGRSELASKLSVPFFIRKTTRLKEIEEQLTAKGFLAPVFKVEQQYKYVLYNGEGKLAFYNK